ncbi:MAG TPA: M67 family metallopeptidase [Bryobacterales bacterium]|nr:M67 family metallopeptidase [Bryobacterales bacterium]
MLRIEAQPWARMVEHARATYPDECVGVMLGKQDGEIKTVSAAMAMENVNPGVRRQRYTLDSKDLLAAEDEAHRRGLTVIGIYHSHPDCGAYFSQTDLKNSCPWYSFVVLSIRKRKLADGNSWLPDAEQTRADPELLRVGRGFQTVQQWIRSNRNGQGTHSYSSQAVRR